MSTYDTDPYANRSTSSGQGTTGSGDMKERAVETVAEVDAGAKHVAGVAGEEVKGVAHDAKRAARGFFDETRSQLSDQASTQQHRAAGALRSTSDELQGLASGTATGSGGMATSAVRAVGEQTRRVADWLEQREPADVVYEVRSFARRNTGAFLAIAAGVGVLAGRLTRALVSDARSGNGTQGTLAAARPAYGSGTTVGATGSVAGATAAGLGTGAGAYEGDTPIGDSLASDPLTGDPLAAGADPGLTGGADEWSATGEERR
ncbi:hypothetical protein [Microbacterium sp. NPDC055455]